MERQVGSGRIELMVGNIVEQTTDAVVNAANTKLSGGGGVDGAIHRAAGPALKEACRKLPAHEKGRRLATGEAHATVAGDLPAKWVIHAVGPFYNERYREKACGQLRQVHLGAMQAAADLGCRSIAFPAISTGAYRFPMDLAAEIALQAVADFLQDKTSLERARFTLFTPSRLATFENALLQITKGTV
ncbi:MAG: macro domain-containing protein [Planctomycetales bacterium]